MLPRNDESASREAEQSERDLSHRRQEVNEELVLSALRAHEAADAAEDRERSLVALAELRERLVGILGHDLRNPLAAMMMGVGVLIAHGKLNEEDARVAGRVLTAGNRMSRMISQILEFTRARLGGGLVLDLRPVDLGDVCRTMTEELELAASVHVRLSVEGDVSGSWDADRLVEVLSNITGNAIEHAQPGSEVTVRACGAGAEAVVVEICNVGRPIPAEVLPYIFDPFRRAKQSKPSKAGNLGLGLYIAHEIVLAHGGTLVADSTAERTSFTMRLPRSPPPPTLVG